MTLGIATAAGVFAGNVVVGVVAVLVVYRLMEHSVPTGAAGGVVVGVATVLAEWQLGERMLSPTVDGMKLLIALSVVGAVVGVVGTMLVFRPDL